MISSFAGEFRFCARLRSVFTTPLFWLFVALLLIAFGSIDFVHAADATESGGSSLPWESPLSSFSKSISGPVAFAIALLGLVACGATLIWGGEITEFVRRMIYVILVICLIVFAKSIMSSALFSGAVVPQKEFISSENKLDIQRLNTDRKLTPDSSMKIL